MNGRENNIYYQDKKIVFSDFDAVGRIRMSSLMRITSVMAMEDYADRGCPWAGLVDRGLMFLVAGVHIKVHGDFFENQLVTVGTYEKGVKGAACLRDYFIADENGKHVASAASSWIVCDLENRRILRPTTDRLPWQMQENPRIIDCEDYARISMPADLEFKAKREVRYSDIDVNGHVNNSIYGDIASDYLDPDIFEKGYTDIVITYHKESSLGDTLSIYTKREEGRAVVRAQASGRLCFDLEIKGNF